MPAAPLAEPRSYPRNVTCWHSLPSGLSDLAVEVVAIMGVPKRMLAADFRQLVKDRDSPFPRDMSRSMRSLRLSRLLEQPVRVGDILLRMETRERRHIYDKTQTLVTERAELPPASAPARAAVSRPDRAPDDARLARAPRSSESRAGFETEVVELLRAVLVRLESVDRKLSGGVPAPSRPPVSAPEPAIPGAPAAPTIPASAAPSPEHHAFRGRRLPRPLFAYRVDEIEENLAVLLRALELPEVSRGPLIEPAYGAEDCVSRVSRVLVEAASVIGTMPGVEPYAPAAADLAPVSRWGDLGPRLTCAARMLNRVAFARPDLGFEPWSHPDLADPAA